MKFDLEPLKSMAPRKVNDCLTNYIDMESIKQINSKKWRLELNSLVWAHGNACDCCESVTLKNSTGLNLINKQASCRPQRLSKTEILSFIYLGSVFERVVSAINHINYCTVNSVLRNAVNLVNNGPQKSARIKVVRCKREWQNKVNVLTGWW